jgi:hypothetical protein
MTRSCIIPTYVDTVRCCINDLYGELQQLVRAQFAADGVLTLEVFVEWVKKNHPMAKQADLQTVRGEAIVQSARGSFDPKLWMNLDQKYFEEKQYYSHLDGGLKIPTWFGVELSSGYEQNEGVYLDPENGTPGGGLYCTPVSHCHSDRDCL